jgi:hypothetical protein
MLFLSAVIGQKLAFETARTLQVAAGPAQATSFSKKMPLQFP